MDIVLFIKALQFNPQELWSIQGIETKPEQSCDTFLRSYQSNSISQMPDRSHGTYTAKFLWKEDKPCLPSNLAICTGRAKSLVTKFRHHPNLLKLYKNIIKEQERRGFIQKVDDTPTTSDVHYLSHHAVKKDSQTTPIRVVYDCMIVIVVRVLIPPLLITACQWDHPLSMIYVPFFYFFDHIHLDYPQTLKKLSSLLNYIRRTEGSFGHVNPRMLTVGSKYINLHQFCLVLPIHRLC